ncbi:MAG: hypothetical protein JW861_03115 [Bacteroidales bacterium]|nr:hypothetical protein [Bacteroidales bacterium]
MWRLFISGLENAWMDTPEIYHMRWSDNSDKTGQEVMGLVFIVGVERFELSTS